MQWVIASLVAALVFGILDGLWLSWAGNNFYRPGLGELMADQFLMAPAALFYVLYIAGVVWFAIRPGLENGPAAALLNGALLGGLCYATYDLTNQATLKVWPGYITVVDIAWGAFATGLTAAIATFITSRLT